MEALELIEGDGTVVLSGRSPKLPEIGDVPLKGQLFNVFAVRNGRIASVQECARRGDGLTAAAAAPPAWS